MVWKEHHQVTRDALAGRGCPFSGHSVVQAQVMAMSARPSSPPHLQVQKATKECAPQVHTWDANYFTAIANATKSC